jgi:transcription elongation factor Elf1
MKLIKTQSERVKRKFGFCEECQKNTVQWFVEFVYKDKKYGLLICESCHTLKVYFPE